MAWLFLLWLSNGARIAKEAKSAALESCPVSRRHCLCLPGRCTWVLGAGRGCGHYSGATHWDLCQGSPPWQHCSPWAGSRLLMPHLLFLVKNSLEVRQRGAEVFALSVSSLLSVLMPRQWSRKVKRMWLLCSGIPRHNRGPGEQESQGHTSIPGVSPPAVCPRALQEPLELPRMVPSCSPYLKTHRLMQNSPCILGCSLVDAPRHW